VLESTHIILDWPDDQPFYKADFWQRIDEKKLLESIDELYIFKRLEERGYGDMLVSRYPGLRKYFAEFIQLPFAAKPGTERLLAAINVIHQLDAGTIKKIPEDAPAYFIPKELIRSYKEKDGKIRRNAWELGLAVAMKEALRSGDLYLAKSKQHTSFGELILDGQLARDTGKRLPRASLAAFPRFSRQ